MNRKIVIVVISDLKHCKTAASLQTLLFSQPLPLLLHALCNIPLFYLLYHLPHLYHSLLAQTDLTFFILLLAFFFPVPFIILVKGSIVLVKGSRF